MQIYSNQSKMPPLLYSEITKINAIPQIYTFGGDIYYAPRNLLIHLLILKEGWLKNLVINIYGNFILQEMKTCILYLVYARSAEHGVVNSRGVSRVLVGS